MGDLSKDFSKSELTCKCGCGLFIKSAQLVSLLQKIRDAMGRSITVTSGTRCTLHNKRVKGVTAKTTIPTKGAPGEPKDSNHTHGTAADIVCSGMIADALWIHVRSMYKKGRLPELAGLGRYDSFCHVDVDPKVPGHLREWDDREKR
ncbi:MAG: hypothetical protein LBS53_13660 [Synergistaceae bacterium]|jgi:uncharacterized protein YcbK (DUF882 family)|nr:hypothetical protein [Synergistaceae bacterium]